MVFPEIAKLMAYKNMRQKDLGKIIGCTQQATSRKLKGKTDFKRSEMIKIKEHFKDIAPDITIDQIFHEEYFFYKDGS